jgi:hypothetical protein
MLASLSDFEICEQGVHAPDFDYPLDLCHFITSCPLLFPYFFSVTAKTA